MQFLIKIMQVSIVLTDASYMKVKTVLFQIDVKQIEWEEKRNRWLQGYNKALGKKEGNFKSRGNKGKRPTDAKKFSKAKKQRRF